MSYQLIFYFHYLDSIIIDVEYVIIDGEIPVGTCNLYAFIGERESIGSKAIVLFDSIWIYCIVIWIKASENLSESCICLF